MSCVEVQNKKYQTRKGPPYHANDCKGKIKKGNDGKSYVSSPDKNGIYKWIPRSSPVKKISSPRRKIGLSPKRSPGRKSLSPSRKKTYLIVDNGARPFVVDVYGSRAEIYHQKYNDDREEWERDKKVYETPFVKIFIGDNDLKDKFYATKGQFPGSSILLELGQGKYIYVGDAIYSFETRNHEKITKYYSPVGNSQVPYPYAVGENNTYFMLDKKSLPNSFLDLKKDAYGQFYGHTVEDKENFKKIDSAKQKMKTKQIHKRGI